jgi:hypothetical protein
MKKIFALIMVMSIVGGILAGCGSKDDAGATTSTTATAGGDAAK